MASGTQLSAAAQRKRDANNPGNKFAAGDTARFSGKAVDGSFEGDTDVKVVNGWSNKDKVTNFDNRGVPYEGGRMHIPTATVQLPERKRMDGVRPARNFEAYHYTLSKPSANK